MAIWMQHDVCAALSRPSHARSYVMSVRLARMIGSDISIEPITLFTSEPGHALLHCDAVTISDGTRNIIISQKYSSLSFVLQVLWNVDTTMVDAVEALESPTIAVSTNKRHITEEKRDLPALQRAITMIKWGICMRQCPSPSLRRGTLSRMLVAEDRLPDTYRVDIEDVARQYYKFPDGGLQALLCGADVPGIPQVVAFSVGRTIRGANVDKYTLLPGEKLRLADPTIDLERCTLNRDNLYADFATALDLAAVEGIDPTGVTLALKRFGISLL
ncbi:hypothetical protein DACRYDRAFT_106856 [Dacryopinax primogenitus]|uniref:Uncharacterized protein n=1 Tax=Dacryopinax primogenitus (strain DJM 731) TaxID=1858805 RepID=M5FXP5_DACPD|nr:uncharacterized protein DACRYDRAFT_106856 [Dacryopinax primogenitus]EJU02801.1 hypothetical protein DACRYDRAFT_106856 [Dacryopinax primogenitus]